MGHNVKKKRTNKQEPQANNLHGVTNFLIIPQQFVTFLCFKHISAIGYTSPTSALQGSSEARLFHKANEEERPVYHSPVISEPGCPLKPFGNVEYKGTLT